MLLSTRKAQDFLVDYMQYRDVPTWYRGTSTFQIAAADQLANSIRDDVAQETSHRVRNCLNRLGLLPAVRDKDLKMLMRMSGGNDLAFLWFLMELYYKTPGEDYSSLNEQLILTSIAHLDMITTLRELDHILPPGHASKRQLQKRQRQKLRNKSWLKPQKPVSKKLARKHSSPYFNKLERPVQYGKPLNLERPDFKVQFIRYEIYKDPNYVPPNEENRWYAKHVFNEARRISTKTIREVINNLSDNFELTAKNKSNTALQIIDFALSEMDLSKHRDLKVLCKKHQFEEQQKEMRMKDLMSQKKEKCLENLDFGRKAREKQLEKIQKMLETEVEMYRLHYRKKLSEHKGNHSSVRILGKEGYCEHLIEDERQDDNGEVQNCSKSSVASIPILNSQHSKKHSLPSKTRQSLEKEERALLLLHKGNNRLSFGSRTSELRRFQSSNPTPRSSERYFVAPTENKPYRFSYPKIFHYEDEYDQRIFIKNTCVEALDADRDQVPKMVDQTPDLGKLTEKFADETWRKNEEQWRKDNYSDNPEVVRPDPYPRDMPRLSFYDCEDKKLMNDMLKIALHEMAKNPKFVLASLPDAHKLPMLREWIYQRYGKRYTHAQRIQEVNMSLKIMSVLQRLKLKSELPSPHAIASKHRQNYKCHSYIMKKVNLVRQQYYNRLNSDLLTRARYFWFAMRIALCALPTRATFFAYLPARTADNYLFKPWKLNERMEAKEEWDKRRFLNKQELLGL